MKFSFSTISATTLVLSGVSTAFPLFSQGQASSGSGSDITSNSPRDSRSEARGWPSFPQRERPFGPSAGLGIKGTKNQVGTYGIISDESLAESLGLFNPKKYSRRDRNHCQWIFVSTFSRVKLTLCSTSLAPSRVHDTRQIPQAAGPVAGVLGGFSNTLGGLVGTAGGIIGSSPVTGIVGNVGNTAQNQPFEGVIENTPAGPVIVPMIPAGTPNGGIVGTAGNIIGSTPLGGVAGTVGNIVGNSPIGSIIANSPVAPVTSSGMYQPMAGQANIGK